MSHFSLLSIILSFTPTALIDSLNAARPRTVTSDNGTLSVSSCPSCHNLLNKDRAITTTRMTTATATTTTTSLLSLSSRPQGKSSKSRSAVYTIPMTVPAATSTVASAMGPSQMASSCRPLNSPYLKQPQQGDNNDGDNNEVTATARPHGNGDNDGDGDELIAWRRATGIITTTGTHQTCQHPVKPASNPYPHVRVQVEAGIELEKAGAFLSSAK
ncbi:hypothetical protein EDB84DRAFT_1442776 [Lactarius hengduanensis]|nr:hypothetical protein EDB84DRAFT_1442776 [Lactarius hengduanensis]